MITCHIPIGVRQDGNIRWLMHCYKNELFWYGKGVMSVCMPASTAFVVALIWWSLATSAVVGSKLLAD